ncbi:MAG: bifunctional riboflavin kinase/FAD synthetase [bacterium]|nr:bifunctional riboflavin kinase/FAD synthetase [bacterium]
MKIIRGLQCLGPDVRNVVLTMGNFDGLHLGHQKILQIVVDRAREIGVLGMVFTFEPHPLKILAPDRCPPLLTTFQEKMKLLQKLNLDIVLFARFTEEFASQHPEEFIQRILWDKLRVKEVYVGYNHTFGRGGKGTVAMLEEFSRQYPFRVQVVEEVVIQGENVSSTAIRNYLRQGNLEKANLLLGRPYTLTGKVIPGCGRGRKIGFPTANIAPGIKLIPKSGVYLARVHIRGKTYNGLANIGPKPTFQDSSPGVEVYIFDLQADLYHQYLEIELIKRLRDEISFPSVGCLVHQIEQDVKEARQIFKDKEK